MFACHDVLATIDWNSSDFSIYNARISLAFQPLLLANNPTADAAAHQSQQSPATQPIQESAGAHTQYNTGLVLVMVAERLLDQQAAHRQVGGDPAIETGQETAQLLSIAISQQSIQETVSGNCRTDRWDLRKN